MLNLKSSRYPQLMLSLAGGVSLVFEANYCTVPDEHEAAAREMLNNMFIINQYGISVVEDVGQKLATSLPELPAALESTGTEGVGTQEGTDTSVTEPSTSKVPGILVKPPQK